MRVLKFIVSFLRKCRCGYSDKNKNNEIDITDFEFSYGENKDILGTSDSKE